MITLRIHVIFSGTVRGSPTSPRTRCGRRTWRGWCGPALP